MVAHGWADIGDVFVKVHAKLRTVHLQRIDLDDWFHDRDSEKLIIELADRIIGVGSVRVGEAQLMTESPKCAFQLLLAIDRALREVDPIKDTTTTALDSYIQRWRHLGRLNTREKDGRLVFRRGYPARPQGVLDDLDGYLRGVHLVPRNGDHHLLVQAINDIDPLARLDDDALLIGCLSFVDTLESFEITRVERGSAWYSIRIADHDPGPWQERVVAALSALDQSGCRVAVLPELVLTDVLLQAWVNAIRVTAPPSASRLDWILAGTGPVAGDGSQPPNRAVVISRRTGDVVFDQDKRHPFTLADTHIEKWKLTERLGSGPLGEWMAEGARSTIAESVVGRFTICICEDLGRADEAIAVVRPWGVSHVLVPIFAEPIRPYFWEQNSAERILNQVGSGVIVANSQAVVVDGTSPDASSALFARVNADAFGRAAKDWSAECHQPLLVPDPLTVHTWVIPCA